MLELGDADHSNMVGEQCRDVIGGLRRRCNVIPRSFSKPKDAVVDQRERNRVFSVASLARRWVRVAVADLRTMRDVDAGLLHEARGDAAEARAYVWLGFLEHAHSVSRVCDCGRDPLFQLMVLVAHQCVQLGSNLNLEGVH